MAAGDLNGANRRCLLIVSQVDLAPDAQLGATMLVGVPLIFSLDLVPGALDQQV